MGSFVINSPTIRGQWHSLSTWYIFTILFRLVQFHQNIYCVDLITGDVAKPVTTIDLTRFRWFLWTRIRIASINIRLSHTSVYFCWIRSHNGYRYRKVIMVRSELVHRSGSCLADQPHPDSLTHSTYEFSLELKDSVSLTSLFLLLFFSLWRRATRFTFFHRKCLRFPFLVQCNSSFNALRKLLFLKIRGEVVTRLLLSSTIKKLELLEYGFCGIKWASG